MIAGLRVLAVIPARGGSKAVPGKNILPFAGKPLIQYSIDAAARSRFVDRVVVSSDDSAIIAAAAAGGADAPFRRAPELATDEASSCDVVADALERIPGFDIVVLLQPTSPLRIAADIDGSLELLVARGAPSCISLGPVDEHPYWMYYRGDDGRIIPVTSTKEGPVERRQDLPVVWRLNGAVYAARVGWFIRERTFLSSETVGYPMPRERSLDIDTVDDVERFRLILEKKASTSRG